MPKQTEKHDTKLYRHYVDADGKFATESWTVEKKSFNRQVYDARNDADPGSTIEVPLAWIGCPRAAELWSLDADPDAAYMQMLSSAAKDLSNAQGRLEVYDGLYRKLQAAGGKHDLTDPGAPEHKYGKILVMGRAQAGKTTVAKRLAEETGLVLLKTSTSRPKRSPDEDTYHFYTPKEAAAIPMERKLFHTLAVDGFERWTDRDDFLEAGIAVLDPTAMVQAVRLWQAQGFRVTVLYCGDQKEARRSRWMKDMAGDDGSGWDAAVAAFGHRERTEGPMFDELERNIRYVEEADAADAVLYPNAAAEHRTVAGEDRLELYRSRHGYGPEEFLRDFLGRLASADRQAVPYREFPSREDVILDPEDYTKREWSLLCGIFGLVPECTARIALAKPMIKCSVYPGAAKDCDFRKEGRNG